MPVVSIELPNLNNVVVLFFYFLMQFHTAFASCRHTRSAIRYVLFWLFVVNKSDLM